jgi:hypothetical protein
VRRLLGNTRSDRRRFGLETLRFEARLVLPPMAWDPSPVPRSLAPALASAVDALVSRCALASAVDALVSRFALASAVDALVSRFALAPESCG